jgi:hypothetical protein
VEIVAVTIGQFWAGSTLHPLLNVLSHVRNGGIVGVPEDRVAIKTTSIVGSIRPGDIDRIITRPNARGMTGAVDTDRVTGRNSIFVELPVPFPWFTLNIAGIIEPELFDFDIETDFET